MKILFIGGNGNISWYCVQKALERGHEIWELNREMTRETRRAVQPEVHCIRADIRKADEVSQKLQGAKFDVICDFICFNEEQAQCDIALFRSLTEHFIFISSEAVYKRMGRNLPFKEECEKNDPNTSSSYIGGKIMAERTFMNAFYADGFPVTIIRPAYTYDVIVPVSVGQNCFTAPQMYLDGYPVLIAGDGNNLWTFTHSSDFANAFVSLLENRDTIGEAFHIASNEWLTWNEECEILVKALGIDIFKSIHIPYDDALKMDTFQPRDLMFQRMWHNIYDTSKVKSYVNGWEARISFEEGIRETIAWLNEKNIRRRINPDYKIALKNLYKKYGGYTI